MGLRAVLIVGLAGVAAWYLYENREALGLTAGGGVLSDLENEFQTGVSDVESATLGWASVGEGPTWVPVINEAEASAGIPTNLLARMAYEESSFRQNVIDGTVSSSAGAQGILQLEPASFPSLRLTPPYSTQDTSDQISAAAAYLMQLYNEFADWSQAVGAYNAGPGTMSNALSTGAALPAETVNYVDQIFADVPVAAVNIPA
jgi:soluble lytic murein transglycosylase-like protein